MIENQKVKNQKREVKLQWAVLVILEQPIVIYSYFHLNIVLSQINEYYSNIMVFIKGE
jgi:hypothetical protein